MKVSEVNGPVPAMLIYVTTESTEQAAQIGRALIDARLAACVNILPGMTSIYRWEGKTEQADETVLLIKTTVEKTDTVTEFVKARHSYSCPSILAVLVTGGNPEFLDWIATETGG